MRKIFLSLVTILAAVTMVAGATSAVFSDTDYVRGNTITAAHLTIDAREVIRKPIIITNMLPGQKGENAVVDLYNDGNVSQRQWMYVENVVGADLCQYVELELGYSYNVGDPYKMDVSYGTFSLSSLTGSGNAKPVGRSDPIAANITTRLVQIPHLLETTPNTSQQKTCTWDEVFVATQVGFGI